MAIIPPTPDTFRHQGLRHQMVAKLRKQGITDEAVLEAMDEVPRHYFVEIGLDVAVYDENPIKIGFGQTISRPYTVAMQSQLLMLEPGMRVLEIGTGSGYQTSILYRMGARVYTIERQNGLYERTKSLLQQLGYSAQCYLGDGYKGLPQFRFTPFDRVLITCGAPFVPPALMEQLRLGGIMVIPVDAPADNGTEPEQEMLRITKRGPTPDEWEIEHLGKYCFVPMLKGRNLKTTGTL